MSQSPLQIAGFTAINNIDIFVNFKLQPSLQLYPMTDQVKDIDTYLSIQPEKVRIVLEKLRHTIKSVAPEAEEVISYQMPAFKYNGMLVGFAAFKNHCSLFPWNSRTVLQFKDELKNFKTSKGTIQFTLEKPLPVTLVKKIVKARLKENMDKKKKK